MSHLLRCFNLHKRIRVEFFLADKLTVIAEIIGQTVVNIGISVAVAVININRDIFFFEQIIAIRYIVFSLLIFSENLFASVGLNKFFKRINRPCLALINHIIDIIVELPSECGCLSKISVFIAVIEEKSSDNHADCVSCGEE